MSSIWVDSANVGSHFVKLKWAGWTLFFLGFSMQTSQYRPLTIQRTPLSFLPFLSSFRSPSLSFLNRFSFSLPQDREGRSRYAQLDGIGRLEAGGCRLGFWEMKGDVTPFEEEKGPPEPDEIKIKLSNPRS